MSSTTQPKSHRKKWLLIVLTPCLVLVAGGSWLVNSRSGLEWLVSVAEQRSGGSFIASGVTGSLFDSFGLQQVELRGDGWRVTLQGTQLHWTPAALLHGELKVLTLAARQVDVLTVASDTPSVMPDSLQLPLLVNVGQIKVDSLRVFTIEGAAPAVSASDVGASFISDASSHQLRGLRARLPHGDVAGDAEMATAKPYALKAQVMLDMLFNLSEKQERAHFVADAGGNIQNIAVKFDANVAQTNINGSAHLEPFAAIRVSDLQIAFEGMDIGRMFVEVPPALLSGSADLQGTADGSLEGNIQIRNARAAAFDRNGLPVLGVTAQVRLSTSNIALQQLDIRLPNDGHITGEASWEERDGKVVAHLKVQGLDPAALDTRLKSTRLKGDISLASAGEVQQAAVSLSDGTLDLQGDLKRRGNKVELSNVTLTRGKTVLSGYGELALDRRRTFRFSSKLRNLNLNDFVAIPRTDLNADMEVSGTLLPEISGALQFKLFDSYFADNAISGNGFVEFAGMQHATAEAEVRLGDNQLNLTVLHSVASDSAQLKLNAPNLAQLGIDLEGQLAGNADLSGSFEDPRVKFSAQGANLVFSGRHHIAALDASGDLASASMQLNLAVKDYRGKGALNVPEATLTVQGSKAQHTLHATAHVAQDDNALGEFTLNANGGLNDFGRDWNALQWQGVIDELSAQGVLPFHLLAPAPLTLSSNSVQLGAAEVAVSGGKIQVTDIKWTAQGWHSAGRFSGLNLRAVNMQQNQLLTDTFDSMSFGGFWDVKADDHLQGQFQLQRESGDWVVDGKRGLQLGLRDMQFFVSAQQNQLQARLDVSGERMGEVTAQASVPLTREESGWTILPEAPLVGHLGMNSTDLSWLGPILDSNLQTGGQLDFDAQLLGTFAAPRLQGVANGTALSVALLDQGIRLEQGELKARFENDIVHIDKLAFEAPYQPSPRDKLLSDYELPAGAGQFNAHGRIDLVGDSSDLQISAERMPLAQRADRWIIASGNGQARYAKKILLLEGNIHADVGLINQPASSPPRLSDDVQILGEDSAVRAGKPISVDATLNLGERLYIRASGLEGRLAGQLKVRGKPGESLQVTGIIAAHDAVFDAYGQRLQVERGLVNFQGPLDDPGLNILALRKGLSVEAGVEVTGTVRRPSVRLVSTPNVPDGEKLSWIMLGRVPESTGVDSSLLLAAASSILGGQSAGKFGETLGIDEISLSQQEGGDSFQSQKVTVGKQLSSRARISYEQGLSEVGGVTKFTYTLTPRITIVTRTGIEDALDIFYSFRFY